MHASTCHGHRTKTGPGSSCHTSLPLEDSPSAKVSVFRDAIIVATLPLLLQLSMYMHGSNFSVERALPTIHHNKVRNLTTNLMTDVYIELTCSQYLTGNVLSNATARSDDGARLDIAANG